MVLRSAAIACATALMAALAAPANAETAATCETASFRVYFAHGSSRLSPAALETLEAAARGVEGCAYAELNIAVEGPQASRRAQAIRAAADGRDWAAVRIAPRMTRVAYDGGPDYVEVTMATQPMPEWNAATPRETAAGV